MKLLVRIVLLGLLGITGCGEPTDVVTTTSALNFVTARPYLVKQLGTRNGFPATDGSMTAYLSDANDGLGSFDVDAFATTASRMPTECQYRMIRYPSNYSSPPYSNPPGGYAGQQDVYANAAGRCWCGQLAGWMPLPLDVFRWYYTSSGFNYMAAKQGPNGKVCSGTTWTNLTGTVWPQ